MLSDVSEKVIAMIAAQARVDPQNISQETSLSELGLDSLAIVEVIFAIEEHFDISVPINSVGNQTVAFDATTVESVVDGVRGLLTNRVK